MRAARLMATPARLAVLAIALALPLAGCEPGASGAGSTIANGYHPDARGDVGSLTYRAVDRLVAGLPDLTLGKGVAVASIVDEQRVDKSTPFGNQVADLARSRLVQKGVLVYEMRMRSAVLLDPKEGVITLANDRTKVVAPPSVTAILTGTYAAGDNSVTVSLKLVSVSDARIVGAVDFVVPRRGSEQLLSPPT